MTMSMLETLKAKLLECRKASKTVEMGVLQVVLGDASMIEARTGKKATDEEIEKLIRKTMLGNQETLGHLEKAGGVSENIAKLTTENTLLKSLLPATMSVAEIVVALAEVAEGIKSAKNDGQATGVAMKLIKSKGLKAVSEDVAQAIKQIRG
jgi:uncharacterized protein YqeY